MSSTRDGAPRDRFEQVAHSWAQRAMRSTDGPAVERGASCVDPPHPKFGHNCRRCLDHPLGGSCAACWQVGFDCSCTCNHLLYDPVEPNRLVAQAAHRSGIMAVILTACVHPHVRIFERPGQARAMAESAATRLRIYQHSVRRWATHSNLTIIVAESCGADLAPLEQVVPK